MKISCVLNKREQALLIKILDEIASPAPQVESSDSDLDAVQKMYINGEADLLMLDLDLPAVIGSTTIRSLRNQEHLGAIPIVVLSESEDLLKESVEAGSDARLLKPVTVKKLQSTVRRVLYAPESVGGPGKEARRNPRIDMEAACLVATGSGKQRGVLKDISLRGARVVTKGELPLNGLVTLSVAVPGTSPLKVMQFKARVVRGVEGGYGLEFKEMNQSTRAFLNSFVK